MNFRLNHYCNFHRAALRSVIFLSVFLFLQHQVFAQTTLFPFGSDWRYLDNGSDQGTAWRATSFNDLSWATGNGQFGYGDGDETTIVNACGTPVPNPSCNNKYITTYFRKTINIPDLSVYTGFVFDMYRDDGVVVYVNGTEVNRTNMPTGAISYTTQASGAINGSAENTTVSFNTTTGPFVSGLNTIAVEVHQESGNSSDLSFDMQLTGLLQGFTAITTGPYLQKATPTSIVLRWYTASPVDSKVSYGTSLGNLSQSVSVSGTRTNHTVTLNGLTPYTKYYYSIETSTAVLQSGVDNYFLTLPDPGSTAVQKYTFWVTGDVGNNSTNQRNVRDRFINYMGNNPANGWLLLGDNAYTNGLSSVYITNFFDIYENNVMRNIPLWPATGNHEYENNVDRQRDQKVAYFDFFETPTNGESGGVPSNSEAYYSFNYGNIHFVALDSYIIENNLYRLYDTLQAPQVQWLKQDLAANTKPWTIVYFHHPPYSMGSHNSDTETQMRLIRERIARILERYKVDLVLAGHSHSYERSKLMKDHFGLEASFLPLTHHLSQSSGYYDGTANSCPYIKNSPDPGTIYAVAGSAGMLDPGNSSFPHDALPYSNDDIGGSLILEIEGNRLDAKWLASNGSILDKFTMMKEVNKTTTLSIDAGESVTLTASWVGQYSWSSGQTSRSITVTPASSGTYTVSDPNLCLTDTYNITVNSLATITIPSVGFTEICAGSSINISYSITGTFAPGNVFTLQLSNASGSFSSPVNIGSLTGTTAGTINGVFPANTTSGSNYRLRIVSSSPVVTGTQSAVFSVNAIPTVPVVGTITQPTCSVATGSVVLSGLPSAGTWTLTRTPGSIETTGTGASTTISDLASGTYTYTVRNASNCVSPASSNIVINVQPVTPTAPIVGTTTQPTCSVSTGSVVLSGLPSSGTWTLTRSPGGSTTTGTGTSTTVTGLPAGTYTFTVTNAATCISPPSSNVVIDTQPATPPAPVVETIIQPTCSVATGSVELSGLPSSGTWTLTRNPGGVTTTGTGTSVTLSGLAAGTYTYTVTDGGFTCVSASSANVVINAQPVTPTAPVVGAITQPTCAVATGSVVLSGLPSSGSWTITRSPGGTTITGTGTSTTISGLPSGTYTFTVTNASTCVSPSSGNVVIDAQPVAPTAPIVGTIIQPTCSVATGSVELSGLPSSGNWTLTRSPGGVTTTGAGTGTTLSGLPTGSYTYTVADASGCISSASGNVVIDAQPATPTAPTVGSIIQPTCTVPTGSVVLSGLPSVGTWTLTRTPGNIETTGTGTSTTISGLLAGTYTFTVTNAFTCVSSSSSNVVIDVQPSTPTTPIAGTITQPTCALSTGSVVLNGLPSSGTWTITRSPGGTTTTGTGIIATVSGIPTGTYTFTVTNASNCVSASSGNVVIDAQPVTPTAPTVGAITQPTCTVSTGSVILSGLPSTGTWTLTRTPGGITTSGTGTSTTVLDLSSGTYTYTVAGVSGCISPASANVVINAQPVTPAAPVVGTITQPTCAVATGSVVLSGLPSSGTWTLTRSPGGTTITGTGTSSIISGLPSGTYTFTVTNSSTCVSPSSNNVDIDAQPATPTAPIVGTITQPTCSEATGSVVLSGLPSSGNWTLTRNPGGATTTGSGSSTTVSGLSTGTYTYTVTDASGCISPSSGNVVIDVQPVTPAAPVVGTITQPACTVSTGSVVLSGLPSTGSWTLTRSPDAVTISGSGASATITGIPSGNYTFTVTNASTCISPSSNNVVINTQPTTPAAPILGTITQPTCAVPTGSVVVNGLPSSGSWTLTRLPGGVTTTGTGTSTTISGLPSGTYTYTVTNASGCISPASGSVIIDALPSTPAAPIVGNITQPTCTVSTGSVVLSGLPSSGTWTLTRSPGGATTTGTGASTILSGLLTGTYTYTVTDASGCISPSSGNMVIDIQPATPTAPTVGTITQPTCTLSTGSVVLNGLPSSGTWTITRSPGGTTTSGTGISAAISGIPSGTYTFTVTNTSNCVSVSSGDVVIDAQPVTPTAPIAGTITQPTCTVSTGSVVLNGLPSSGTWTLTRSPGGTTTSGTGTSTTVSALPSGTYTYTVTNASGCSSPSSGNVVIDAQPPTPAIANQTTSVLSGETFTINPVGVPEGTTYTWTTPTYTGGVTGGSAQSTPQSTISGILSIPSGTGTATYTVTPTAGSCVGSPFTVTVTVTSSCEAVTIGTQPANSSMCLTSGNASFTVGAIGTSPFSYQWEYNNGGTWVNVSDGIPGGAAYTNANTATLGVSGVTVAGSYQYRCSITNCSDNNVISSVASLEVNAQSAPSVGTITQPTCAVPTGSVVLSGLPSSGSWALTRSPGGGTTTGTGTSTTLSGLPSGTYIYTVTNESGCISLASGDVVIDAPPATPTAPVVGTITQPTCSVATGSVVLNGLPASGTWTLTKSPGGSTTTGTGTTTSISALNQGTYTFTVTNASGCISPVSSDVVINAQPAIPAAPTAAVTSQPTCTVPAGTITVSVPANGVGISYTVTGTMPATTSQTNSTGVFPGLTVGEYDVTTTINGCTSLATVLTVDAPPGSTGAPAIDSVTQPTCTESTGTVELSGLPVSGTWTVNSVPEGVSASGTGGSFVISGLDPGSYSFTVTDESSCVSSPSPDVVIDTPPETPVIADQAASIQTGETFSITPTGVPDGTTYTWTEPTYTNEVTGGSAQSIPQASISGSLTIPAATGTATYTVTPTTGSCVGLPFNVQVTVSSAPLPVELLNFTAHASEDEVTLRWITASELNNDYFEVQRFITQEEVKSLGRVPGKGTTRDKNDYEFIDAWPVSGNAYYRLKQVDFDGKYEYSKILRVSYNGNRSVKLYPNPGDGTEVTLALGMDEGPLSIVILDATGRHISTSFTHTQPNSSILKIKFESALTSGMYFFQITSKAGITTRKWLVL